MRKKLPGIIRPNVRIYYILLGSFAVATYFLGDHYRPLSIGMALVTILAAIFVNISTRNRYEKLLTYLNTISDSMDITMRDTPLPVLVFNPETGEMIWANDKFNALTDSDTPLFYTGINDIIPDFKWDWLLDGRSECEEPVKLGEKLYWVYGKVVFTNSEYISLTYWVDVTSYVDICNSYMESRPVHALLTLDNYDELFKGMTSTEKSLLLSEIDEKIGAWVNGKDGYLCRFDRDRYFFLFEEKHFESMVAENFPVLEQLTACVGAGGVAASMSIGIGKDGATPQENYKFAGLAMEMALSRGGNQAVVRNKYGFEFYGGRPQTAVRRTKVKARVMANAFSELLSDASKVIIMGHKAADYDSFGSAAGVFCIARAKHTPAYIIIDESEGVTSEAYLENFKRLPEYAGVFISEQEAILLADKKTLLVVVDTNRPGQVQSQSLLLSCTSIAIVDHHRRAADYIDNAVLNFHEPYASSSAELIAEMMQNLIDRSDDILREEAEALLAGIFLDTKNFTVNTGSGTFDAAAYLKRSGADPENVKRIMQSDFKTVTMRYSLMKEALIYREGIVLAVSRDRQSKVSIAQAADELLEIKGVLTSFAVAKAGNKVCVSGRNIGEVNVQVILEQLGGGGSASTAGYQTDKKNLDEVVEELKNAIDDYVKKHGAAIRKALKEKGTY